MKKKVLIGLIVVLLLLAGAFFLVVPAQLEKRLNVALRPPPYAASERAIELHKKLLITDLHADSLLWDRNLNDRATRGHVDIPRLIDGNVALQAFTVVTKTPYVWKMNIERNDDKTDNITILAIAERWPTPTWSSLTQRAHDRRSRARFGKDDRRCACHRYSPGCGVAHRSERHLRQPTELERRPIEGDRSNRRRDRNRLLGHGGVRQRRKGDCKSDSVCGRSGRSRSHRARIGL